MLMREEEMSAPVIHHFLIGPDSGGHWIVCDAEGSCGAVFANREDAVHFTKSECEAALPAGSELRFVASLNWRSMIARQARKVA
jgi:hypothetical protein